MSRILPFLSFAIALPLLIASWSCSSSDAPIPTNEKGVGWFQGTVDPESGKFILSATKVAGDNGSVMDVVLLGDNVEVDAENDIVSLDVTIRNDGGDPLYGPSQVVIADLSPNSITVLGSDWDQCTQPASSQGCEYGLSYSGLLGEDDVLSSKEESEPRNWSFYTPGLIGFTFSARVEFSLDGDGPRIAGTFFADQNRNGVFEAHESPVPNGVVYASGPELSPRTFEAGPDGRFEIPVEMPGLYTLLAVSPESGYTTPNPLQVILPVDDHGNVQSVLDADFGVFSQLVNPICFDFNNGTLDGWMVQGAYADLAVPSLDGTAFLISLDGFTPPTSAIIGPSILDGDWSQIDEIRFDYNVFDDGWEFETRLPNTLIHIASGPGVLDGLRAAFIPDVRITDAYGDAPGWHSIVAPVHPVDSLPLPGNEYGHWAMISYDEDMVSDWNALLQNVGSVWFPVDFASSPSNTEILGLDNICFGTMSP